MNESPKSKITLHLLLIALFSIGAMSVAYFNGLPSGNDIHQHYQFAYTIHNSLTTFEVYPSFAANFNNGYGDVALRFYPPMAYYVLAISYLFIGNWYFASLFAFTLFFFISGIGAYFWAREEFSPNQSLLAAAIFVFAPHHVNQIYNNFLLAEFASAAVIPFCFLFITRVCRKGRVQDVLGLAAAYAFLILTHLPLTIIGSIVFGIYALLLLEKTSAIKQICKLGVAVLLGVSASSFYWIRMITELDLVNHAKENYFQNIYSYGTNFLFAPANIINFHTDSSVLWLADLMLLSVLLISIPSIIFSIKESKNLSKFTIAVGAVFIFAVFMTTPLSKFIWENLSFLQKVQFPWRWLGIVSICGALFASGGIIRASEMMKKSKNLLFPIGLGLIFFVFITTSSFIAKNAMFISKDSFDQTMSAISTTNSFECWWTIWAKNSTFQINERAIIENRIVKIEKWDALERTFKVSAGNAATMRVATIYYPHWQATVNGATAKVEKTADGAILITLPEAESTVNLVFREPNFVRTTNVLSFLVWLFLIFGIAIINGKKFFKND